MKTRIALACVAFSLALTGTAVAAREWLADRFDIPIWARKGIYLGGKDSIKNDHFNKICGSYSSSTDYNAPSLADGVNNYFSMTLTGARVGDPCMVGFYEDAGATRPLEARMECEVVANDAVRVIIGNSSNDGGALDLPSGSYRPRVFSSTCQ